MYFQGYFRMFFKGFSFIFFNVSFFKDLLNCLGYFWLFVSCLKIRWSGGLLVVWLSFKMPYRQLIGPLKTPSQTTLS